MKDNWKRMADALLPGASGTWQQQWQAKLADLNDAATYQSCDVPDCVLCEMEQT